MSNLLIYLLSLFFPNSDDYLDEYKYEIESEPDLDSDIYVNLNSYNDIDLTDPQHFFMYG